jgi:hypothetical protein
MPSINLMKDRERKLAESIKKLKSDIRKAEKQSQEQRYLNFGNEMEKMFQNDPTCSNTKKIAEICRKYFSDQTTTDSVVADPVDKNAAKPL